MNEKIFSTDISKFKNETTRQLTTFNLSNKSKTIPIPRGKRVTIGEVKGQGYIAQIWMTFPGWFWQHWDKNAPVSQTILKTLILRIYWDDQDLPAIQTPVGDFFGNGLCEISNFTASYFGMSSGGFYCKFPMPFKKGFRIELENLDETIDTEVFANILYQITDPIMPETGYLHTQFNTAVNNGPDAINILEVQGKGYYVGCILSAQGKEQNYFSFLEAPEYIFVDDDWKTPRIVGTGLEDYFLGGWYFREGEFTGAQHGVPSKDGFNSSITMYRTHNEDAVSFNNRIKFQFINPWDPDRLKEFAYSSVAFYYLDSPKGSDLKLPEAKDLLCWYRIKNTDHVCIP